MGFSLVSKYTAMHCTVYSPEFNWSHQTITVCTFVSLDFCPFVSMRPYNMIGGSSTVVLTLFSSDFFFLRSISCIACAWRTLMSTYVLSVAINVNWKQLRLLTTPRCLCAWATKREIDRANREPSAKHTYTLAQYIPTASRIPWQ